LLRAAAQGDPDHGKQGAAEAFGSQSWCSQANTAAPISPDRKRLDLRKADQIKTRNDALARLLKSFHQICV
jgi:hypothetical protein